MKNRTAWGKTPGYFSIMTKVLVIEDEEFIRENIAEFLQIEGYSVRTAKSGSEGLGIIKDWNPDIILCDWLMSGMNGDEVFLAFEQLKQLGKFIFITAAVDLKTIEFLEGLGTIVIKKPFNLNVLLVAIASIH